MRLVWQGIVLYSGLLFLNASASASCLGSGDPKIEALAKDIGRQPYQALAAIEQVLSQTDLTIERRTWLEAARAQAKRMLGQEKTELPLALEAAQVLPANHPALLHLQIANLYGGGLRASVDETLERLLPQLALLPVNQPTSLCLKIRLASVMADIEALNGETFELASNAYRSADNESLAWMRAEAASVLGQIALRTDGDYGRMLSEEALRYFEAQQMHDMVANELYMSAFSWWKQRDSQSLKNAEQLFRRSADAAQRADNPFGVAYAEAGLCGVLEQQGRVAEALQSCRASLPKLKGIWHITEYSTNVNYAAALLANKEPGQAMVILESLAKDWPGWDVGYHGYRYYFIRGQTYAALGHYEAAVSDLNVALSELLEFGDNSWARNNRLVQARFRVEQLAQSLERKTLEAAEKDRRHRLLVVSGVIVTLLLSIIVMMLLRHRRFYRRMAFTDPLTGLANRRYTEARAQEAFAHAKARQQPLFIALLDLDRFKTCNDRYGHDAGDEALKRFAYVASKILRPGDIFGRWGGEEFLLVLQGVDREGANTILERLRSAAAAERLKLAPDYPLHFSAGVVGTQQGVEHLTQLLSQADQALYRAKETGRNCNYFAEPQQTNE